LEGNVHKYLTGADTDVCYYKMDCPASMKTLSYEVLCKFCVQDGKITSVIAARCSAECPAGQSGQCVHVAALLLAVVNVLHPLLPDWEPPSTSHRCWWNIPGRGDMYNYLRPVCYIPFTKEDINNVDKKKQSTMCTIYHGSCKLQSLSQACQFSRTR
jgi:hypothetical protein